MPFCLTSEIIQPRVNNFDIKQKRHGIFVLLNGTNIKQDVRRQRLTRHNKFQSKHKSFSKN